MVQNGKKKNSANHKKKREQRKKHMEYLKLHDEATKLGDEFRLQPNEIQYRAYFDKAVEALQAAPTPYTKGRFRLLRDCLDINFKHYLTKGQRRLLREVFARNENEAIVFRALVASTLSYFYLNSNHSRCHSHAIYSLDLIARSPPKDFNQELCPVYDRFATVGIALNSIKEWNISYMADCYPKIDDSEKLLDYRLWGGEYCDCCKKPAFDVPGGLKNCVRCEMMYYCSEECQRIHWEEGGHNKGCHKQCKIRPGEYMLLLDQWSFGPCVVMILEPFHDDTCEDNLGNWLVSAEMPNNAGVGVMMVAKPERLVPIRQDKALNFLPKFRAWCLLGSKEIDEWFEDNKKNAYMSSDYPAMKELLANRASGAI